MSARQQAERQVGELGEELVATLAAVGRSCVGGGEFDGLSDRELATQLITLQNAGWIKMVCEEEGVRIEFPREEKALRPSPPPPAAETRQQRRARERKLRKKRGR